MCEAWLMAGRCLMQATTVQYDASYKRLFALLGGRFIDNLAFTWDKHGSELQPSWVESGVLSDDAMHYTIRLREGVRWSDGTPVTTTDLMFTYQDVAGNTDLNPRRELAQGCRGGGAGRLRRDLSPAAGRCSRRW